MFKYDMGIVNISGYNPVQNNISAGKAEEAKKNKDSDKDSISFGDVMNLVGDSEKKVDKDKGADCSEDYNKSSEDAASHFEKATGKKYDDGNSVSDKPSFDSVKKTTNTEVDSEDIDLDAAGEIIRQAIELIAKLLNVDEAQVAEQIEKLGADISLLMDDAGIKQLALSIMGATEVDILVDETINDKISELTNELKNIFETFDNDAEMGLEINKGDILFDAKTDVNTDDNAVVNITEKYTDEEKTDVAKTDRNVEATEDVAKADTVDTDSEYKITAQTSDSKEGNQDTKNSDNKSSNYERLTQALADVISDIQEGQSIDGESNEVSIVRQIVDDIRANISDKVRSLELQLNPENLGKVWINVSTKDGVLQARIVAENEAAKEAIENSLSLLKEAFEDKELKVEAIEVMVGSENYFNENAETEEYDNNKNNSGSGGNTEQRNDDIIDEELTEATQLEKEMMQQAGNSVSYSI